jgi:hypothetical protein
LRGTIEAVAGYMTRGGANLHGAFVTSREVDAFLDAPERLAGR